MKILTNEERENIIKNVNATMAIEGKYPSETAKQINWEFLKGNISSKEAVQKIKDKYLRR